MARREPIAFKRGSRTPKKKCQFLSRADLNDLLTDAGVPSKKRVTCEGHINQLFDWYCSLLVRNEETEARRAETLRLLAEAARDTYKRLTSLAPALRLSVEPDFPSYVRKQAAAYIVEAKAGAAAASEIAKQNPNDPDAQRLASEAASL